MAAVLLRVVVVAPMMRGVTLVIMVVVVMAMAMVIMIMMPFSSNVLRRRGLESVLLRDGFAPL